MLGWGRTDGVRGRELELQTVGLIQVEGVLVEDPDVEEPFFKVVRGHQLDPGREVVVDLRTTSACPSASPHSRRDDGPARGKGGTKEVRGVAAGVASAVRIGRECSVLTLLSSLPNRLAAKVVMALFCRRRGARCRGRGSRVVVEALGG